MHLKYGISRGSRMPVVLLLFLSWHACLGTTSAETSFLPIDGPIRSTMEQLAAAKARISAEEGEENNKDNEAKLWRHLGKLQLDAGEYAEARQIFCSGAMACPFDEGLQHHLRVYNAFHGQQVLLEDNEDTSATTTSSTVHQKPSTFQIQSHPDMFLSLDVPDTAIPKSVKKWKGRIPPDTRTRLLHATKDPLLPREACRFLIQSACEAVTKRGGWTKDRHIQAPTCDIPVFELSPEALSWCRQTFRNTLFPLIASTVSPELDVDPQDLRIQDCFIVRYDGNGENGPGFESLKPHQDESLLSLTIALNDMDEYSEGGLFVQSTGDLLNGNAGTVLCFAGGLVHGGYPVTQGTRWILTVFLYVDANESGENPGYTLQALDKLRTTIFNNTNEKRTQE